MLARLCIASFVNQAVVFPLYLIGVLGAYAVQHTPEQELQNLITTFYAKLLQPEQQEAMHAYISMLRAHGVALMGVFALRTLARFVGTYRMWQGWKDGFHIYTSAQLLGMLVPMLIAGPKSLNILGFFIALNWCYLYFTQRKVLKDIRTVVGDQ